MPRKLKDIVIDEISLVDKGANKKKFAIIKEDEIKELLESFFGEDSDAAAAMAKAVEDMDPDMKNAVLKAIELLEPYKEDMPENLLTAVKVLAAAAGASNEGSGEYPANKSADVDLVKMGHAVLNKDQEAVPSAWQQIYAILAGPEIKKAALEKALESRPVSKQLEEMPEEDEIELRKFLDDEKVSVQKKIEKLMALDPEFDPWPSLNI